MNFTITFKTVKVFLPHLQHFWLSYDKLAMKNDIAFKSAGSLHDMLDEISLSKGSTENNLYKIYLLNKITNFRPNLVCSKDRLGINQAEFLLHFIEELRKYFVRVSLNDTISIF